MSQLSLLPLLLVAVVSGSATTISNPFSEVGRIFESPLPLLEFADGYNPELAPFIVGGAVAAAGSRPYQAALLVDERYFCGGSLISEEYVVTAGHCMLNSKEVIVVLGAHNLTAQEEGRVIVLGDSYVVHENYSMQSVHDDIALVKLPEKVPYSATIKAIALPPTDKDVAAGTSLIASGWGKTSDQATTIIPVLQEVTVPAISNDDCAKVYGTDLIWKHILCTAGTGGKGTCNGDSGGPLTEGSDAALVLRGVVSFGHVGGCTQGDPDGFTRVAHYVDWIKGKTGIN